MIQKRLIGILFVLILAACANRPPIAEPSAATYYTVKSGDNLDLIAFLLEVPPTLLIRVNPSIDPNNLIPGSRLIVPGTGRQRQPDSMMSSTGYIWPVSNVDVSSPFGYRSGRLHAGIDLRAPRGTRIRASSQGRVTFSGWKKGYGKIVIIAHAGGYETAYAHNNRNLVSVGQQVKKGAVIASMGRTGNATGYHLHFELRRRGRALNPSRYLPPIID